MPTDESGHPDIDSRLAVLTELLDSTAKGWKSTHALAFPGDHVSIRMVSLPFKDRAQVARTLPFEVESLVPFDLEDMIMDTRTLAGEGSGTKVLAAVAPSERVGQLLSELSDLGIELKALPVDIDLLSHFADTGTQAVIDIGHSRTLVALTHEGKTIAAQAISTGGKALTDAIQETCGVNRLDAEELKHSIHLGPPTEGVVADWDESFEAGVSETSLPDEPRPEREAIRAPFNGSFKRFAPHWSNLEDDNQIEVDEVLMTGGGASLEGLADWLASALGVRVREIQVEGADFERAPGRFALCHALALKGHQSTLPGKLFNLRQGAFTFTGNAAKLGGVLALVAAACLVFFLGSIVLHLSKMDDLKYEEEQALKAVSDTVLAAFPDTPESKATDPKLAEAIASENATKMSQKVEQVCAPFQTTHPVMKLLEDLHTVAPPHGKGPGQAFIDIEKMVLQTGVSLTFDAVTGSVRQADELKNKLRASPRFAQVTKSKLNHISKGENPKGNDGEEESKDKYFIPLTDTTDGTDVASNTEG